MKKKTMLMAWLLTLCTLIPVVTACGGDGGSTTESGTEAATNADTTAETEPLDALEARKLVDDELGEYDFGGYEYRIVTSDGKSETLDCDATTGDVIDDAVYERNTTVEERFNCTITVVEDELYSDASKFMTTAVTAGEDAFDICSFHVVGLGQISISDYFMNWYDIPHIDFSKPWWSDSTVNDLTYSGVCVTAIGDMALSAPGPGWCRCSERRWPAPGDTAGQI